MKTRLSLEMLRQPDDVTCGPTCLHAVYRYWGERVSLEDTIAEVPMLEAGGTLAVFLACHALRRGYRAKIYTYNLNVFDPTWFYPGAPPLREALEEQLRAKRHNAKLRIATKAYLEYLELGGQVCFEDLNAKLIRKYLDRQIPLLTGLSATYLYRYPREYGERCDYDDIRGMPSGHFVVLCGYDKKSKSVLVADPHFPNPFAASHLYEVNIDRVICSILLGLITYDGNFLVLEPKTDARR